MRPVYFIALLCIAISFASPQAVEAQKTGADALSSPLRVPGTSSPAPSRRATISTWLMVGGGALLGAGWATNALGGLGAGWGCSGGGGGGSLGSYYGGGGGCQHSEAWENFRSLSLIPVAGPFAQLAALPDDARGDGNGWTGWLIASAAVQMSGLALILVGMAMKLGDLATPAEDAIVLMPTLSPDEAGLSVSGRF